MKNKIKKENGITLSTLVITIIVLLIITSTLIYNANDTIQVQKRTKLYNDIELLREKVSEFYNEYGELPAKTKYTNIGGLSDVLSNNNDIGDFYVIDLEAMKGITLNYGKDYENIKNNASNANSYIDVYIINENSHNIFYVQGIDIKNNGTYKTYHTDYTEPDETTVDSRYIDGILIPDEYYYIGKTVDSSGNESIVISNYIKDTINSENKNQYTWTKQIVKLEEVPSSIKLDSNQKSDEFLKSVNTNKGYFRNSEGRVVYTEVKDWSEIYTKEAKYKDSDGNTAIVPKGFQVSQSENMNMIKNGLVARDEKQNEWVWIEVPKTIYTNSTYLTDGAVTPTSDEDYENIEKIMQNYSKTYKVSGCKDEWYSESIYGLTEEQYNEKKHSMLKSVYNNGGFWIGRYEAGDETATKNNTTRTKTTGATNDIGVKADLIPYNFVTSQETEKLSEKLAPEGKTSSLMFGIQWNLTCKFLEERTDLTVEDFKTDSKGWGNYKNNSITLLRGKYLTKPGNSTCVWKTFSTDTENYITNSKTNEDINYYVLLTAGASEYTKRANIYDFTGNQWECTLEINSRNICLCRGGSYRDNGYWGLAATGTTYSNAAHYAVAFRPTIY